MEYNSFYGGRQGTPFIIAKSFSTVAAMEAAFSDPNYKEVAYNEYVIIDTVNKNDSTNGEIYRRIVEEPGYEKIGQIVGPSGPAPGVEFESYTEGSHMSGATSRSIELSDDTLVPGKDGNNYNDTIDYKYIVIRDNNNSESTVYMGFKIPYTVIEFTASSASSPYADPSITRTDNGAHPFYESWNIAVPGGKHGVDLQNFKEITPTQSISGVYIDPVTEQFVTLSANKTYLVYEARDYESSATGSVTSYCLGEYNTIKNVNLSNNGTFTVNYTNNAPYVYNGIKWISNITGSSGYIQIDYNTGAASTFIWQGTTNSTGAVLAQQSEDPEEWPAPEFAQGSPWFIVEEISDEDSSI